MNNYDRFKRRLGIWRNFQDFRLPFTFICSVFWGSYILSSVWISVNVSLDQTSYFTDAEFSEHHNTSGLHRSRLGCGLRHRHCRLLWGSTRDDGIWDAPNRWEECSSARKRNPTATFNSVKKNEEMKRPQSWTAKDLESFHGEKRLIVFLGGMHTKRIIETRVPNAG